MFFKKKKEVTAYAVKDSKDFSDERPVFVWLGYVYDQSLLSKVRLVFQVFLLYTAPFHHMMIIVYEDLTVDEIGLALSLTMMYILLGISWPIMMYRSKEILQMGELLRKGYFEYFDPPTLEEKTILSKANDIIIKSRRLSILAYFCAGLGTFIKELSPDSFRQYHMPYPGWFPFEMSSNYRFMAGFLYQLGLCVNTTAAYLSIFLLFVFYSLHFEAQFSLLIQHFRDTFPTAMSPDFVRTPARRVWTQMRLKECVQHHLDIIDFHKQMLGFFGPTLFVFRITCTVMLCMHCYMIMGSEIEIEELFQLVGLAFAVLYLLFIFSLKGEKVTAMSDLWSQTLYEVEWWNQPVEVQKTVLLMLVGANRPLLIYGVWTPVLYSHRGVTAIGQETFSFLNMLRAMN
uniref:Odorant receptor n=1 Tax=Cyrtorhinus lividipennis TaxID=1032904 RepID=A0A346TI19_9HEMI|nr:odorant receptor 11 [Cyrtorhinus lividipennis]